MIGIIGVPRRDGKSSFRGLIHYCEKREGVTHTGSRNILFGHAAAEMEALAFKNPRCKDPLMHIILSWREMELPTNKQTDEAVQIALEELDLQNCQAVWIVHNDTQNRHVHVAVNRIDPETHKAIRPAGGWTHRAIQKASRRIELEQGWEIETHGTYQVTAEGELVMKTAGEKPENPKLSKTALDVEAHTAQKSAERVCQEAAAPILREAKSWEELHRQLAEQGIELEKKGSGAILKVGNAAVKASKAGRGISLSKLEAGLGEFRPRPDDVLVQARPAEPVRRVAERKVTGQWERYSAERERYCQAKKAAITERAARHKAERLELQDKQRGEREKLFSRSWKGIGAELNQRRSVLAAAQQGEKLNLRDRQEGERQELKRRFPPRFPNFKTWLELNASPEASVSYRYWDNAAIWGAEKAEEAKLSPPPDIRAFAAVAWNKGSVAYVKEESQARFIDYGRRIVLAEQCGEDAVLAALQLANQKWGGAEISGSEEYKQQCVKLAIQHNLKISNPALAAEVEKGRKEQKEKAQNKQEAETTETAQTREMEKRDKPDKKVIFNLYADAVGAERFRVTVTEIRPEGTSAFVFDRQTGGFQGKTREEILDAMPRLSIYVHYGKNIIITPMSPSKHHILVDDLTAEKLGQLKGDGYSPACVIKSSPGNYQALLTIPSVEGEAAKDREAANRLTRALNQKYGDPKLTGAVHGHRLPPFPNQKPKYRRGDGTYPEAELIETKGGVCEKALQELQALCSALKEAEEKVRRETQRRERAAAAPLVGAVDPDGAYWAHCRDIMAQKDAPVDYSSVDGRIGVRMRVTGYSLGQIKSAIETNGPAMRREAMGREEFEAKYRGRDWSRYARETAEKFVFGLRGLTQYDAALRYRPKLLKAEGRDARKEAEYDRRREREEEQEI